MGSMSTAPGWHERMDYSSADSRSPILDFFYPLARRRAPSAPAAIADRPFLFSDVRCAGDRWRSGDRAAELGGRCSHHPARTSAFTALARTLALKFWIFFSP